MDSNAIPESDQTAEQVSPLHLLIVQALHYGELRAREAFGIWKRKIERNLFNNLVRFHAADFLREHPQAFIEYAQAKINNNGIGVVFSGFHCKVLKASNGRISGSNRSRARRSFLTQYVQPSLFTGIDDFEDALRSVRANLVFLWDNDEKYHIDRLWLALPKGIVRHNVIAYWQVLLPNPLLSAAGESAPQVREVAYDDFEDEIRPLHDDLDEEQVEGQDGTGQAQ